MKNLFLVFFLGLLSGNLFSQSKITLYENPFNNNDGLSTNFNDCDGDGYFDVSNGFFIINNVEGSSCCSCTGGISCGDNCNILYFPPIDVSGISEVDIILNISSKGSLECNPSPLHTPCMDSIPDYDQLVVAYSFDPDFIGQQFTVCCGNCQLNTFPIRGINVADQGCELYVKLIGGTHTATEFYEINHIEVKGVPQACPDNFSFHKSATTYCQGSNFTITPFAEDNCGPEFSYEWFKDGLITSNGSSLEIVNYQLSDTGLYTINVLDVDCPQTIEFRLDTYFESVLVQFNYTLDADGNLLAIPVNAPFNTNYTWILNDAIVSDSSILELDLDFIGVYILCLEMEGSFCTQGQDCKEFIFGDVSSTEDLNFSPISVYPNPVINSLFVDDAEGSFTIIDVNGRVVKNGTLSEKESIDVENMDQGIYFLRTAQGSVQFVKF